jgi:hypothetical protein
MVVLVSPRVSKWSKNSGGCAYGKNLRFNNASEQEQEEKQQNGTNLKEFETQKRDAEERSDDENARNSSSKQSLHTFLFQNRHKRVAHILVPTNFFYNNQQKQNSLSTARFRFAIAF